MSALQRKAVKSGIVGGLPPRPDHVFPPDRHGLPPSPHRAQKKGRQRDYTPLPWTQYFDEKLLVPVLGGKFTVYTKGETGPVLCLLHGGGYSALTWALVAKYICELVECRVVSIDLRSHGETVTDNDEDLSLVTMAGDVVAVLGEMFKDEAVKPDVVLVGHSMGGTIAAAAGEMGVDGLAGLVVVDVVEGTAMEALSSMQGFLRSRPTKFGSVSQAIEWCVRSGQVRNLESARVSMPGQIVHVNTGKLAATMLGEDSQDVACPSGVVPGKESITEEDENGEVPPPKVNDSGAMSPPISPALSGYTWRIDLAATEPHWSGWFTGMSARFLGVPAAKMLLLAGVDRLDRDLTVGQMQGKFQMQVLPQVGHAIHEDSPDKVAEVLASFLTRNKLATATASFTPSFPAC